MFSCMERGVLARGTNADGGRASAALNYCGDENLPKVPESIQGALRSAAKGVKLDELLAASQI